MRAEAFRRGSRLLRLYPHPWKPFRESRPDDVCLISDPSQGERSLICAAEGYLLGVKAATIRDLRYDFPKLLAWIEAGEEILVTKHSRPVAKLSQPILSEKTRPPSPDFRARQQRIWGDRVFSEAEVEEMRAFETGEP